MRPEQLSENGRAEFEKHWHLDKRVPISLILTILLQTAAFVWVIAQLDEKLDDTVRRVDDVETAMSDRRTVVEQNSTNIAVINANLENMNRTLERIESKLDQHEQRERQGN